MNGLPYYPRYPRDFIDGTVGMSFEVKGAYSMLLDLIYMQAGRLPDDPRYIAGLLGCSVRAWTKYRAALIEARKITVENGIISNFRADKLLETSRSFQDKQRQNGLQPKKNKDLPEARPKPKANHTDTDTKEGGGGGARATDADLPQGEPTFRERIIAALRLDPSGITGPAGKQIGGQADMAIAARWTGPDMQLTEAEVIAEIASIRAAMPEPPSSLKYFDGPMVRLVAAKRAPIPDAIPPPANNGYHAPPIPRVRARVPAGYQEPQ